MTTDTAERGEHWHVETKRARVEVESRVDGWTITGHVAEGYAHAPTTRTFEATIQRCPCDPVNPIEHPPRPTCTCNRAATDDRGRPTKHHQRLCHGWHVERVEKLARDIARSYG